MTTKISSANIQTTGVAAGSYTTANVTVNSVGQVTSASTGVASGASTDIPKISNIQVTDSSYVVLDDTAVNVSGGYIKITGTNFVSGCQVIVGSVLANSVTFTSATEIRAQIPAQASGTYTVYLTNPDGGVAIRVNGVNYSSTPTWTTTSPLSGGIKDSPISIQLAATSNSTVTYALQSGSTLPTGLSLTSGGLLSGTVSGIASDTTYNFTVIATDSELQDTPQALQITIIVNDPYYYLTTLHLPGVGTNLANNNTFLDGSANNFAVTRSGNTTQGTFSPFSQTGWGNYFDGSGDYLSVASNAAFAFGTGDFTIEFWFYPVTGVARNITFPTVGAPIFYMNGSRQLQFENYGATPSITTTNTLNLNAWNHCAVSRASGTVKVFVNGAAGVTSTAFSATSFVQSSVNIGTDAGSNFATGYMSNVRIVKGTAVYTSNFTPPTTPLTAISGTSLLTCQSNRFRDASSNNFTITVNGNTSVQAFSPFNSISSWSAATNGGSGYFDGSGDYLTLPSTSALDIPANTAFTVEFWIYLISEGAQPFSTDTSVTSSFQGGPAIYNPGFNLSNTSGNPIKIYWFYGRQGLYAAAKYANSTVPIRAWTHIAWCRDSSNGWHLFVNGIKQSLGTGINTGSPWDDGAAFPYGTNIWSIGNRTAGATDNFYISGLRYLIGQALYTGASLTVPTAPLTNITNTSLLLNFTNPGIYDATSKNDLETVGNAQISTAQSKFGGSSILLDGTDDYLFIPSSNLMQFGTADFTLECWMYITALNSTHGIISMSYTGGFSLGIDNTPRIFFWTAGTSLVANTALSLNTWYHFAATRASGTGRIFLNGVQMNTTSMTGSVAASNLYIGTSSHNIAAEEFFGRLQDIRITRGFARYTSNFTPPTQLFVPF